MSKRNKEKDDKNEPIIPPTPDISPEEALRAFMQVDGKKVKKAEKREREQASSAED